MAYDLSVRLVAYNMDGTKRGEVLSPLEMTYYDKRGDTPTLKASWTSYAATHSRLKAPCQIAFEVRKVDHDKNVVFWTELRNSRFIVMNQVYDRKDRTGKVSIEAIGNIGMLQGAAVGMGGNLTRDGKRSFKDKTPGYILSTLFNEAKSRGCFPWMDINFSSDFDSNGRPWRFRVDRDFEASNDLRTIILEMYANGLIEFWFDSNTLCVGTGDRTTDRTAQDVPVWIRDNQVPSSPEQESFSDLSDSVLLLGDNGSYLRNSNPSAYKPYGTRETVIDAGGITVSYRPDEIDENVLRYASIITLTQLQQTAEISRTYTREWTFVDDITTPFVPLRDFNVGEWIYMDTSEGHKQKMRVADYSISIRPDNSISLSASAGSVRDDALTKMARMQKALTEGAKLIGTGRARQAASSTTNFESDPGVPSKGVKINEDGFVGYNDSKNKVLNVDSKTGTVTMGREDMYRLTAAGAIGDMLIQKGQEALPMTGLIMHAAEGAMALYNGASAARRVSMDLASGAVAIGGKGDAHKNPNDGLRVDGATGQTSLTGDYYSTGRAKKDQPWVQINTTSMQDAYRANGYTFVSGDPDSVYSPGTPDGSSPDGSGVYSEGFVGGIEFRGCTDDSVVKQPAMIYTHAIRDGSGTIYGGLGLTMTSGSFNGGKMFNGTYLDLSDTRADIKRMVDGKEMARITLGNSTITSGLSINFVGTSNQKNTMSIGGLPETTTAGRALHNMYWVRGWNNDYIALLSSSSKNKLDQQPVEMDAVHAMLKVNPITWKDRAITEDNPDNEDREVGFTAENVACVSDEHDGMLETVVFRDSDGVPQGLAYERMPDAYTLRALQDLYERIEKLEDGSHG